MEYFRGYEFHCRRSQWVILDGHGQFTGVKSAGCDSLALGNVSSATRTPPSKGVPSGPWIKASHLKMSSSLIGPATMPSGESVESVRNSEKSRREATEAISNGSSLGLDGRERPPDIAGLTDNK